jgi:hypothetical protein
MVNVKAPGPQKLRTCALVIKPQNIFFWEASELNKITKGESQKRNLEKFTLRERNMWVDWIDCTIWGIYGFYSY